LSQPALVSAVLMLALQAATPHGPGFELQVVSPDPLMLVGRCRIVAQARDPYGKPYSRIAYMTLAIDGRALPPDSASPFEWEVDLGPDLRRHRLDLTAVDRTGRKAALGLLSEQRGFVEAVRVNLVVVPAVVRALEAAQGGGGVIAGLTSADFVILEDGVPQPLTSFSSEQVPASVAIALDNSRSMEGHLWSVQKAVAQFIESQPPGSELSLMTFNDQVFLEHDFTRDIRKLKASVAAIRAEGMRTALYDTVRTASKHLSSRSDARVLILFTDGDDTVYEGDQGYLRSSIDAAQGADVSIYGVLYGGSGARARSAGDDSDELTPLERLASETGGEVVMAAGPADLRAAFGRLTAALSGRYVLGYETPEPGKPGYRSIEVRVCKPGVSVQARRGYTVR